jgi:hypothetical protein
MTQDRDEKSAGEDDKLSIFRHQAATVERKKNAVAEKLQEARGAALAAEQRVSQRKATMRDSHGNEVVTTVQV